MWETTREQQSGEEEPEKESEITWGVTNERQGGEGCVRDMGGGVSPVPFLRHSTHQDGVQLSSPCKTMAVYHRC